MASRIEAHLGLGETAKALAALEEALTAGWLPVPWARETTVRQLAHLVRLVMDEPLANQDVSRLFDLLVPGNTAAMLQAVMGRVGLALSGGGFRASFYHLGALARMAELDMLRHVSVLSCVSGGSIVGACYWLMLRAKLKTQAELGRDDYVGLVADLIQHFGKAVDANLRAEIQPSKAQIFKQVLWKGQRGALDPEDAARVLHELFYAPLAAAQPGLSPDLFMDELRFEPAGFQPDKDRSAFVPGRDNWLRRDKVPGCWPSRRRSKPQA